MRVSTRPPDHGPHDKHLTLNKYKKIDNRNTKRWQSKKVDKLLDKVFVYLKNNDYKKAKLALNNVFKQLANEAAENF